MQAEVALSAADGDPIIAIEILMSQQRTCILIHKFSHPVYLKLIFNYLKLKFSFSFNLLVAGKS